MKKFLVLLLMAIVLQLAYVSAEDAATASLASRVPEKTVLYVELDIEKLVENSEKYLKFMDEEFSGTFSVHMKEALENVKALAETEEFSAKILDAPHKIKAHMVIIKRDKPKEDVKIVRQPKFNEETGERIPGEFDETKRVTKSYYSGAVIIKTQDGVAPDLMEQFKKYLKREKEENPDDKTAGFEVVEVEKGEMISDPKKRMMIGVLGQYIVISNENPKEIWNTLTEAADPAFSTNELYQRYAALDVPMTMNCVFNIKTLLDQVKRGFSDKLDEAKAKSAAGDAGASMQVMMANMQNGYYERAEKIFSLDKLREIGMAANVSVSDTEIHNVQTMSLRIDNGISSIMQALLDGGHKLEAPPIVPADKIAIMGRVGFKEIITKLPTMLDPMMSGAYAMQMNRMKEAVGYSAADILPLLAGDCYMFIGMEKRDVEKTKWNSETQQVETKMENAAVPDFLILLGLEDPENFKTVFSGLFTRLGAMQGLGRMIKKRSYQGTDIYLVGKDAGKEDASADGLMTFAISAVGRYLTFGSWDEVTKMIRLNKASEKKVASNAITKALAKYPDSNMLMIISKEFVVKSQKMNKEQHEKLMEQGLTAIEGLALSSLDTELAGKLKASMRNLLQDVLKLNELNQKMMPDSQVVHGKLTGNYYECKGDYTYKKK